MGLEPTTLSHEHNKPEGLRGARYLASAWLRDALLRRVGQEQATAYDPGTPYQLYTRTHSPREGGTHTLADVSPLFQEENPYSPGDLVNYGDVEWTVDELLDGEAGVVIVVVERRISLKRLRNV
jgi:hypothetical protein